MTNETGTKEYIIERLSKDNLSDVERLYHEVYGKSAGKDYFRIKYDSEYTGKEFLGYIAYNADRIPVAYYGVIPCFLQCGSEKILAAQSADTMTHPKFRFKGMFVELSNITFELCRQSGIQLIFGFPNQNSYHGAVNKLGWKMTHTMECFLVPVKTLPIAKLFTRSKPTTKIYDVYRNWLTRQYKAPSLLIPNSVVKDGFCGVWRDKDYERAKNYQDRSVFQIEGSSVWCKLTNELIIGDLNVDANNFDRLMARMESIAGRLGVRQIQFHASPGTQLHALFSAKFAGIPSFPALFQQFDPNVNIDNIKFTLADIDIF